MNHGFFGQEWATTCKTSEEEEESIERGEGPDADIHGTEMAWSFGMTTASSLGPP